jgi:phosphate uptake regulator
MPFRKLFLDFIKGKDLLKGANEEALLMLEQTRDMFRHTISLVMDAIPDGVNIYELDQAINLSEIDIRRKVLEHLSLGSSIDVPACLILSSIVIDIERIGDFAKNLFELSQLHPGKLEDDDYVSVLRQVRDRTLESFELTLEALREADNEGAMRVMNNHAENAKTCDAILTEMAADDSLRTRHAIVLALLTRYLKRVSAHLSNIASSVANPYHRIGFRRENDID